MWKPPSGQRTLRAPKCCMEAAAAVAAAKLSTAILPGGRHSQRLACRWTSSSGSWSTTCRASPVATAPRESTGRPRTTTCVAPLPPCHGVFAEPAALGPQELSFKAGEILAISDLDAVNDGWLTGFRRAGNWADRKKFRVDAIDRLAGLSTDEVCTDIIKPACSAATWLEHEQERSYARLALATGESGVGTATVFASHAWTFVFAELVASLRFFEAQHVAAGNPPSLFWLDIFVVVRLSHATIDRRPAVSGPNSRRISLIVGAGRERCAHLP